METHAKEVAFIAPFVPIALAILETLASDELCSITRATTSIALLGFLWNAFKWERWLTCVSLLSVLTLGILWRNLLLYFSAQVDIGLVRMLVALAIIAEQAKIPENLVKFTRSMLGGFCVSLIVLFLYYMFTQSSPIVNSLSIGAMILAPFKFGNNPYGAFLGIAVGFLHTPHLNTVTLVCLDSGTSRTALHSRGLINVKCGGDNSDKKWFFFDRLEQSEVIKIPSGKPMIWKNLRKHDQFPVLLIPKNLGQSLQLENCVLGPHNTVCSQGIYEEGVVKLRSIGLLNYHTQSTRDSHYKRRMLQGANDLNGWEIRISNPRGDSFTNSNSSNLIPGSESLWKLPYFSETFPVQIPNTGSWPSTGASGTGTEGGFNPDPLQGQPLTGEAVMPHAVDLEVKVFKIKSSSGVMFVPVTYNTTVFLLIYASELSIRPAEIRLPEGQHIVFLSKDAAKESNESSILVSFQDGSYVEFDEAFLNEVKSLTETNWLQDAPRIKYLSHGLVSVDNIAYPGALNNTAIEVLNDLPYRNLMLAARTSGQFIQARIRTSDRGFVLYSLPSSTRAGKFHDYRVCLYCLYLKANTSAEVLDIFGGRTTLNSLTDLTVNSSTISKRLAQYLTIHRSEMYNNEVIPSTFYASESLYLTLDSKYDTHSFLELTRGDLESMLALSRSGSLKLEWFTGPYQLSSISANPLKTYFVDQNGEIKSVSNTAAKEYVTSNNLTGIEPELSKVLSNVTSDEHYLKSGGFHYETPSYPVLLQLFFDSSTSRLFLSSHDSDVMSRFWPRFRLNHDHSETREYFLDMDTVRLFNNIRRGYFSYADLNTTSVGTIIRSHTPNYDTTQINDNPLIFDNRTVQLTKPVAEGLWIALPSLFDKLQVLNNPKTPYGQRVVLVNKEPYFFNEESFKSILAANRFNSTQQMDQVYTILNLTTETMYKIDINSSLELVGKCAGKYLNGTKCTGNYSGSLYIILPNGSTEYLQDYPRCDGVTDSRGCTGSYTARIPVKGLNVESISSNNSSFDFNTVTGSTTFNSTNGTSTRLSGKCLDKLNLKNVSCHKGVATFEDNSTAGWPWLTEMNCGEDLNPDSMDCSQGAESFVCQGYRDDTHQCVGNLVKRSCPRGGNPSSCKDDSDENNKVESCFGYYNAGTCDPNALIIPLNSSALVYGYCIGERNESQKSCKGYFVGNYTICNSSYSTGGQCDVDQFKFYFSCNGTVTTKGCVGVTKSNYSYQLDTKESTLRVGEDNMIAETSGANGTFTFNDFLGGSRLISKNQSQPLETFAWQQVACSESMNVVGKTCTKAQVIKVRPTEDPAVNITTKFSCSGKLDLTNKTCLTGTYSYSVCEGRDSPSSSVLCNGNFTGIECSNGGSGAKCAGDDEPLVESRCNGLWNSEYCLGDHTNLYIKLNDTDYLLGQCDGMYEGNFSCSGSFYNATQYVCNQDPYKQDNFLNVCGEKRKVGNCSGILNSTGCFGVYKDKLKVGGQSYFLTTDKKSVFNYSEVNGSSVLRLDANTMASVIKCPKQLNTLEKTCKQAVLTHFDVFANPDNAGEAMGRYWLCNGVVTLQGLECSKDMSDYQCQGSYLDSPKPDMRCLGIYISRKCAGGGNIGFCQDQTELIECKNRYFNGTACVDSLSGSKDNPRAQSELKTLNDSKQNVIKVAEYVYEEYTLDGPTIALADISNATLDVVSITSGRKTENGDFVDLAMDKHNSSIQIGSGVMSRVRFETLQFDNLNMGLLTTPKDGADAVLLTFRTLVVTNAVLLDLQTANSTVRRLRVGNNSESDYKYQDMDLSMGLANLTIQNFSVILPIVDQGTLQSQTDNSTSNSSQIEVPKLRADVGMQLFKLRIRSGGSLNSSNYIEWDTYQASNLMFEGMSMQYFILNSRVITKA